MFSPDLRTQFALSASELAQRFGLTTEINWETFNLNFIGDITDQTLDTFIDALENLANRMGVPFC